MGTNVYLAGTGAGGAQNALAQVDVQKDGRLVGVWWAAEADLDADAESAEFQLSFGSAYATTSDQRMIISSIRMRASVLTAVGAVPCFYNGYHPLYLPVSMGERIFLHASASACVTSELRPILSFDFDLDRPLARRR